MSLTRTVPTAPGGVSRVTANISANTAAAAAANTDYIYNATVAGITLTLLTAVGNVTKYTYKNSAAAAVSLASTSAQTFDGTATPISVGPGQSLDIFSDGANWIIL